MSADLLHRAAAYLTQGPAGDEPAPFELDLAAVKALAQMLDRCADAFPIDHTEPPRNPRDRKVVLGALVLAGEILPKSTPMIHRPGGAA